MSDRNNRANRTARHWAGENGRRLALAALMCLLLAPGARAQDPLLDDIETAVDQGIAQVRIRFTLPVRYLRHFPPERGELVNVYFQITSVDGREISLREEKRKVKATPVLPGFTVTYIHPPSHDLVRDPPYLLIQFERPVSYKLRQGDDNRSIHLYIPVTPAEPTPAPAHKKP
jgi:hypothetical protein